MEIPSHFRKAILISFCLTILAVTSWEIYLRISGHEPGFIDDKARWAHVRNRIDQDPSSTVMIGSSRIQFDIDQEIFTELTGASPVQLAMGGSCPLPLLEDIADNTSFKGTLFVGVTEGLFFSQSPRSKQDIIDRIAYYKNWTLAQRGSFHVSNVLQSSLLFVDKERFSLVPLLKRLPIDNREGVWVFPNFPLEFANGQQNRHVTMSKAFVSDTLMQREMKTVWTKLGLLSRKPGVGGDTLKQVFSTIKKSVDKIKARGGRVIFLRCPSSGPVLEAEQIAYPRERYWNELLSTTDCAGIHFKDYPKLSGFDCPEWSHLSPDDTKVFTRELVSILKEQKLL